MSPFSTLSAFSLSIVTTLRWCNCACLRIHQGEASADTGAQKWISGFQLVGFYVLGGDFPHLCFFRKSYLYPNVSDEWLLSSSGRVVCPARSLCKQESIIFSNTLSYVTFLESAFQH